MHATALFALAVSALALAQADGAAPAAPRINGWYPCADSRATKIATQFECAEVEVPLCHEGICKSTKSINLFVKRILATKPTKPRKAIWFLEGGPGYASVGMEGAMKLVNLTTASTVDMYTLDHRGVGRSNFLECQAAQAFAAGSPGGVELDFPEIPDCVKDIMFQIENKTEAYSVTSAAKDVAYLIDALNGKDAEVYVYGGSYGTYWGARVMHLAPKQVRGYILDGVVDEKSATFTTWNKNRRFAEARFLKLCEKDKFCSTKLAHEIKTYGNLANAMRALYKRIDTASVTGKDACADLVRTLGPKATPSLTLKGLLGKIIQSDPDRVVLPALIRRLMRCSVTDVAFLKPLLKAAANADESMVLAPSSAPTTKDLVMGGSDFLGALIKASELWTTPSPSWADELQNMHDGLFSTSVWSDFAMVCFLRGNFRDPMCRALLEMYPNADLSKLQSTPFVYKPDAYWHKYAPIPSHASVLVINGGLDFQTPSEWGAAEYNGLTGGEKMLVEFETGVHCAGLSPQTASDTSGCGIRIIGSYVLGGGRVAKVDTSCIDALPTFDFADLKAIQRAIKSVTSVDALYG